MTTLIEQQEIQAGYAAQQRDATLRAGLQEVVRSLDRVTKRFSLGLELSGSKGGARLIKMCELIGSLEQIDKELSAMSPSATLPHRASIKLVADLKIDLARTLNADPTVQEIAGRSADVYLTARRVLHYAAQDVAEPLKRTGTKPTADRLTGSKSRKARRKEARGLVAVIKTKGGAAPTITATLSSDAYDMEGDRFVRSALVEMRDHLKGRLCFLDHNYSAEFVFGSFTSLKLVQREYLELDATIKVAVDNPRALQTYKMIKAGHRHGASVGVLVQDTTPGDKKGQTDITSVVGLEASIVGIPSNQVSGGTRGHRSRASEDAGATRHDGSVGQQQFPVRTTRRAEAARLHVG